MAALTAPRFVQQVGDHAVIDRTFYPVADNQKMFVGGIAVLSGGYLQAGSTALGLIAVGIIQSPEGVVPNLPGNTVPNVSGVYDNTVAGHAAGAFQVQAKPGVYPLDNSAGGDQIAAANIGQIAYIVDDHTVALTDGNATRSPAGRIMGVDASGQVLVSLGLQDEGSLQYGQFSIAIPVPAMSAIANAGVLARFTPGFAGRLKSIQFQVTTPVTTGSKLATLTPAVAGVNVTGGACALTSANCTPLGANVAGSAITAGNVFTAAQELTVVASSVTAFVEGAGAIVLNFG